MVPIKITKKLSANPRNIQFPEPGNTRLEFDASGPGQVEIQYSINPTKSVRFWDGSEPKTNLLEYATLSSEEKTIEKDVKFCHHIKEKLTESFIITAVVRKKADDGTVVDASRTTCICTYYA